MVSVMPSRFEGIPPLRIEPVVAPEEHVSPMARGSFDLN